MAAEQRVAFLGLGIMGSRMAANLLRAGFHVTAWNRTRARAEQLASDHGAVVADTPAAAVADADLVITMVVDAPQVEAVLFGSERAADALRDGALVADMSTIAPGAARELAEAVARRGARFLDAPVSGSRPKAEDGTLTIMVGGEAADVERARPAFRAMGELIVHVGPIGQGQTVKLINNTLAAVNAAAVAEALTLARKAEVDLDALAEVVAASSGASFQFDLKQRTMREHDFEPLFKLEHMLKDIRHLLAEGGFLEAATPLAERTAQLYAEAAEAGRGEADFAAVIEVSERASGLEDVKIS